MTWPTGAISEANVDAGTDSPATARNQILDAIQKLNTMIAHGEPVKKAGDTMTGPLTVTGARSSFIANSEQYAIGAKYSAAGGFVYFGATDATATPGWAISNAGGGTLVYGSTGGRLDASRLNVTDSVGVNDRTDISFAPASGFRLFNKDNTRIELGTSNTAQHLLTTGGNHQFLATAPKIEHVQSSQVVGELAFAVFSGRGQINLITRDTAGANARTNFYAFGTEVGMQYSGIAGGMFICDSSRAAFGGNGALQLQVDSTYFGHIVDNTIPCGKSGQRWTAIWAANGTIQTSDARDKVLLERIDPAKAHRFIQLLEPWFMRWIIGGNKTERVQDGEEEYDAEVYEEVAEPSESVQLVDGVPRLVRSPTTRRHVVDLLPVIGPDGEAVTRPEEEDTGLVDGENNPIKRVKQVPVLYPVPRMQKATRPRYVEVVTPQPGHRVHATLVAQQVRAALEQADLLVDGQACGLWVLSDPTNPDSEQSLRYDQFIPFIVAAMQYRPDAPAAEVVS